jgi:hypothetical protein
VVRDADSVGVSNYADGDLGNGGCGWDGVRALCYAGDRDSSQRLAVEGVCDDWDRDRDRDRDRDGVAANQDRTGSELH